MTPTLTFDAPQTIPTDALAVVVPEKDAETGLPADATFARLDSLTGGLLADLFRSGEMAGKLFEMEIGRASCRERV